MYSEPSSSISPYMNTFTVFGCVSWLMARASRRKREVRSFRLASFGWRILMATIRFMAGWEALYTEPMPPVPIFSRTKNWPPKISRPIKGSLGRIHFHRYQKLLLATSTARGIFGMPPIQAAVKRAIPSYFRDGNLHGGAHGPHE